MGTNFFTACNMESAWLKSTFQETEYTDAPQQKRMKFSEVSAELHKQFPQRSYSTHEVSRLIREVFPHTESKRCGKSRQTQILGLERIPVGVGQSESRPSTSYRSTSEPLSDSASLFPSQPGLQSEPMPSQRGTSEPIGQSTSLIPSYSDLLIENHELRARIQELERTSAPSLCSQADRVIRHKSPVSQGPSSLSAFYELDFDSIASELKSCAPDLYQFYMTLGDTKRNQEKGEVTTEEVKAVSSLCSLLNARSARMTGLQLLVSMMLVARATSKQVLHVYIVI